MHLQNSPCNELIEKTAAALNEDIVAMMLLAVQRDNLQLSVKTALKCTLPHTQAGSEIKLVDYDIVRGCLFSFPYIWLFRSFESEFDDFYSESVSGCVSSLLTTPVLGSPG